MNAMNGMNPSNPSGQSGPSNQSGPLNVVVLHRIPFGRVRYDLAVDHRVHTVRYLCLAGEPADLPEGAEWRTVDAPTGDARVLAKEHADWLGAADRVIARSEYDLLTAARLRAEFGIPGDGEADLLPVRDKWLMRTLAREAALAQPEFWSVEEFPLAPPAPGTYLIKPRLEASSSDIETGDRATVLDRLAAREDLSGVFVEEFVPGGIWHVDGFLKDGRVGAAVCSAYVGDCLEFAFGSPLGSGQVPDEPALLDLLRATLTALGQRNGSFHFEAIRAADGRFLFLETASRVGGAGVADTFELRTGINLYQADLHYQLWGTVPDATARLSPDFYGWFVFPAHHSTGPTAVDFDPDRFAGRLHSYVHNARPDSRTGRISYAAGATPLSGVVRGPSGPEVRNTLREIVEPTEVVDTP